MPRLSVPVLPLAARRLALAGPFRLAFADSFRLTLTGPFRLTLAGPFRLALADSFGLAFAGPVGGGTASVCRRIPLGQTLLPLAVAV